jgi:hypothetical protein
MYKISCLHLLESGTHVQREVSHLFLCHTQWWMNILITRDGFRTLMNAMIAYLIHTNMVQWTSTTTTHVVMMATLKQTRSYNEWTLGDDFIPLTIKTCGCFHSRLDSFLIACAHTTIMCHQWSSLVPSMLVSYYRQCVP